LLIITAMEESARAQDGRWSDLLAPDRVAERVLRSPPGNSRTEVDLT
jgi:hypothetical protein